MILSLCILSSTSEIRRVAFLSNLRFFFSLHVPEPAFLPLSVRSLPHRPAQQVLDLNDASALVKSQNDDPSRRNLPLNPPFFENEQDCGLLFPRRKQVNGYDEGGIKNEESTS